ncbi:OprO/OprP family phosphate-selective porin [Parasphingorhabdus halotolerans]|uniref:Porin n=1 Tax=Parasphingorhabdus halotolerans TaxID=2725558 RepID=A0A6H2DIJ7_9SPHN|nr:porin [Parasphingorhabdus halotolerans]QJB68492.1 porin [Parasphingorhabdus halotolerans]
MKLKAVICAGAAIAAFLPLQAQAAPITNEEASALLDRLNQLEQEVVSLRAKLSNVETVQQAQTEQVAAVEKVAQARSENSIKWKGAPEIKSDDGWSFKPRGRALFDFASLSAPSAINTPDEGFSNEARRIRLGVQGTIPGGFGYKIEADFADGVELTDAYLEYSKGNLAVIVGQHNNFQSLEELSSSNDTSFIERSAFTDAFGFERKVGVSAQIESGDALIQGGVFTDNLSDLNGANDSIGFDGRIVYAPKFGDTQLHFGGSAHWRDLGDTITSVRYRQRPLIHSVDTRFINTGNITGATSETSYGLEAAVISGRFHAAAETHWAKVSRTGMANPTFFGGSIEAGLFLTDDKREYKGGVFKGVKVSNPVGSGGLGAWQVNVRYDRLDLVDAGIIGGTQDGYMASLIWTPIDYVRFLLNYGHLEYGNAFGIVAGAPSDYSVDVFGARAQISF